MYKIIVAKRKVPLANDTDKRKIFEKIGDCCCDLGAYDHALLSYQKTVSIIFYTIGVLVNICVYRDRPV